MVAKSDSASGARDEVVDLASIGPESYLRDGFFDADGDLRERLNGLYSLAAAHRLWREGVAAKDLGVAVEKLERLVERGSGADETLSRALEGAEKVELQALLGDARLSSSATFRALASAAARIVDTWRDAAALAVHLRRMRDQLAYVTALGRSQ